MRQHLLQGGLGGDIRQDLRRIAVLHQSRRFQKISRRPFERTTFPVDHRHAGGQAQLHQSEIQLLGLLVQAFRLFQVSRAG
ncbi:hypothetical protein D3C81_1956530 [compost metagenome]